MITFTVVLDDSNAWAVAQFLKRISIDDIAQLSKGETEAYETQYGLEQIRQALNDSGVAPR
jgi:hypothetical protein